MPMAKNSSTVRTSLESASMSFAVESKWREGVSALRHVSKIRLGTCRAHVDPAHPSEKPGYPQSIEEIFPTRSWDATPLFSISHGRTELTHISESPFNSFG